MFDPVILVTVNVTVPLLMDEVDVIVALPLVLLAPLRPELLIAPVKLPVTVALATFAPFASLTFTTACALNLLPEATQLIVMLLT